MTRIGYISNTEELVKVSRSNIDHNAVAAFKLSERYPLPPAMFTRNLSGG
jgi:hypothetical protein